MTAVTAATGYKSSYRTGKLKSSKCWIWNRHAVHYAVYGSRQQSARGWNDGQLILNT